MNANATKTNKVFDEMVKTSREYEQKCHDIDVAKEAVREVLDHDKYWEWVESHPKPEFPFTDGQNKALRLWYWSESDELNMNDHLWDREVHDFVETLRSAGIETFTMTNSSTSLMDNMHALVDEGCTFLGLCKVESTENWNKGEMLNGVRFAL